jgi:hypothetical protein
MRVSPAVRHFASQPAAGGWRDRGLSLGGTLCVAPLLRGRVYLGRHGTDFCSDCNYPEDNI